MTELTKQDPNNQSRIPCPFDPSHTVAIQKLDVHKTKCRSRPREPKPYYTLNMNVTLPLTQEELTFQQNIYSHKELKAMPWLKQIRLDHLKKSELDQLIQKVQIAFDQHVTLPIKTQVLTYPTLHIEDGLSLKSARHLYQQSSLLGHMHEYGMLKDKTACFMEFGAGKGELSGHLKDALQEENGESTYILIDRKNVKHKYDSYLLGKSKRQSTVRRILMDIKDLNLAKMDELVNDQDQKKKVVCLSKHLCGSATDITLKCLMNYVEQEKLNGNSRPISGIIIALCCHQICRYEMYPNNKFLEKIGITNLDFARVCKMSSWATCSRKNNNENADENSMDSDHEQEPEEDDTG
ncbi:methyltransferase TRM13-domain-containing protein [Cunninghamella echinulata]|nr:methyltransferase TRM13-domain-containing protein [Cunninghamella echinulata]